MKDVVVRAFKTFIQAAISYVCTISFIDIDWSDNTVVGGVILAALAAGISALMNIDWDAISLEKAAEAGEAEDDTGAEEDADDVVDFKEDDAADDAIADESVEDEVTDSDATEVNSAEADADATVDDTSDEDTVDADTTEVETEKACG